ncbi:MAG: hypothetical protein JSS82_20715 [Bacteroidetes bacterium]|nr:hypothetical protein [Bacteroidota bacterium]
MISILAIVSGAYLFIARPYQLHWGATTQEINQPMPGDELDPHPTFLATRAITVNAPAAKIWPWLVQMGFNRAGFYGYDIIEGIGSKAGIRSADTIVPALQHPQIGDVIPISLAAQTKLFALEPCKYLIWSETVQEKRNGGFTWALYPIDSTHTRLVSRIRWSHHWNKPAMLPLDLFTEFTDHLAVRKILKGIKVRAERGKVPSMALPTIEFFALLVFVIAFLVTMVRLLIRPLTWKTYLHCLVAGALWLIGWYTPISF